MTKQFEPDNELAEESFKTLLEVLRQPGQTRDKITAASKVLEFVQKKPQTASEVTLNKAESFLEAVLADTAKE